VATVALVVGLPALAGAADGIQGRRYYLGLRYAESNPLTNAHDAVGLSLGVNLNRHLGLELAADFYEVRSDVAGVGVIGDLGTAAVMPLVRLRYPFLEDRLVPYLVGGFGLAVNQFNDRKIEAPVDLDGNVAPMGAVGGGIEYHVADNVAIGFEGKYLLAPDQTIRVNGVAHDQSLDTALLALSIRLLYPQLDADHAAASGASGSTNLYFGVRAGLGRPVHRHVFGDVEADAEHASIGGTFDQLYGVVLGANVGRHLAVELPFEGYEMNLHHPTFGFLGEYALYAIVPEARLRWPLLQDRLEPYLVGGVGLTYGEFNDQHRSPFNLGIDGNDLGIGATIGAGLEYFVVTNVAVGVEGRYLFARGHELQINDGPQVDGNLDSMMLTVGLRVFLFELGRGR
jgi:opacity protein-like surface antigen